MEGLTRVKIKKVNMFQEEKEDSFISYLTGLWGRLIAFASIFIMISTFRYCTTNHENSNSKLSWTQQTQNSIWVTPEGQGTKEHPWDVNSLGPVELTETIRHAPGGTVFTKDGHLYIK